MIKGARSSELRTLIPWVESPAACKRWAGPDVRFPMTPETLCLDIGFADDNAFWYVSGGAMVAFGQLLRKDNGWMHLARIIVDPAARGRGYGRRLCLGLIRIAVQKGCQKLSLNVYRNNLKALCLYADLGFREVVEKSSAELCHMVRNLSRAG